MDILFFTWEMFFIMTRHIVILRAAYTVFILSNNSGNDEIRCELIIKWIDKLDLLYVNLRGCCSWLHVMYFTQEFCMKKNPNPIYFVVYVVIVFWSKLEIVLYKLFVLSCPTKLTGLYRTVSTFALSYTKFTLLIWTKMAWWGEVHYDFAWFL